MKHLLTFLIIAFVFSINVYAKKVEGRIIYEKDTINVTFNIPVALISQEPKFVKLQLKVKYYDSSGKIIIVKPNQAKEIRFKIKNEEIRMLSRYNSLGLGDLFNNNSHIFLKIEIDGRIKLFTYYEQHYNMGTPNSSTGMTTGSYSYTMEKYLMQKDNGELFKARWLSFKKDI